MSFLCTESLKNAPVAPLSIFLNNAAENQRILKIIVGIRHPEKT